MNKPDAETIKRLRHAAEVAGWIADGVELEVQDKRSVWVECWVECAHPFPAELLANVFSAICGEGITYRPRPRPTPKIRPFTEKEAQRFVGCVLVSPEGRRGVCSEIDRGCIVLGTWGPSFSTLATEGWHYHIPGSPDELLPCGILSTEGVENE